MAAGKMPALRRVADIRFQRAGLGEQSHLVGRRLLDSPPAVHWLGARFEKWAVLYQMLGMLSRQIFCYCLGMDGGAWDVDGREGKGVVVD